jgi:hypothetical protein
VGLHIVVFDPALRGYVVITSGGERRSGSLPAGRQAKL